MIDTVSIEDQWLLDMARRLDKMQNDLMDFGDALFVVAGDERDWPPSIPKPKGHKWAEGFDKPKPFLCDDCRHRHVCAPRKKDMKNCPDYRTQAPVEGMADLHCTTGDPLPGNVVTEEWLEKVIAHTTNEMRRELDKAIAALKAELMPEIRRAQYPVYYPTVADGHTG